MTLYDLKVGDEVIIENFPRRAIEKIVRVTSSQIILSQNRRFRKHNGNKIGAVKYDYSKIRAVVPELVSEIKEKEKMKVLVGKLQGTNWARLPNEVLVKICVFLEENKVSQVQREKP